MNRESMYLASAVQAAMKRHIVLSMLTAFAVVGGTMRMEARTATFAGEIQTLVVTGDQAAPARVFDIVNYGAVGDGVAMNTEAIQKTIDACHASGGGIVRVPAGKFQIGTIRLKSNITLSLDHGSSLLGSTDIADYMTEGLSIPREGGPRCLIYAEDATNITIEGLGEVDGRGTPEAFPRVRSGGRETSTRPRLLRMVNCDQLTFSGVTYRRPAFWGLHLIDCRNVQFNAVTIRFRNNNFNNDGLDIDGCENVLIENCDIDSGDDAICLKSTLKPCRNIVVRGCRVSSNTASLKLGTSSRGGFIGVKATNCYFYDSPMGAIKLQLVDGGRLEDIDISHIAMENVGNPIFIRLGNRGRTYTRQALESQGADAQSEGAPVGTLKNVRIRDVVAEVKIEDRAKAAQAAYKNLDVKHAPEPTDQEKAKAGPIMITGIPGHFIENIVLENVKISYPGGGTTEDAQRSGPRRHRAVSGTVLLWTIARMGRLYPSCPECRVQERKVADTRPDRRKKLVLEDVEGFVEY